MKNNRLLIGQMAKLNHTTLATLRHYDKVGILSPVYVNPETGYRYYDVQQCLVFHMIQHHKALNMSLKEIKEILRRNDYDFLEQIYKKKLDEVNQALAEFEFRKEELERMMKGADHFCHRPPNGFIQMGFITAEYVYEKKAVRNYVLEDIGSVIYDASSIEGQLIKSGFTEGYLNFPFVTLSLDDIKHQRYRTEKLGIIVQGKNREIAGVEQLPSSTSVFVYFEDFSKLCIYTEQIIAFCHAHNYTPAGDMICRLMGVLHLDDFKKTTEVFRLSIPVEAGNIIQV
ncbi:MerR family transcriptional regulator [uncultured Dialister sp.]|uniref:MerR family transcriptional regulator n=1 Tax=uncultured Dialister sp. TaxID=278064 RepID=UPI00266FA5CE|nr:MerR family transcriptional regulator [uncultured Dialister sp.]